MARISPPTWESRKRQINKVEKGNQRVNSGGTRAQAQACWLSCVQDGI